jgi:uncharacterized protein
MQKNNKKTTPNSSFKILDTSFKILFNVAFFGFLIWAIIRFFTGIDITGQIQADNYPVRPSPMEYVNDFAKMLSSTPKNNLEEKLSNFSGNNPEKIELVLVTVNNLSGKDIKEYSIELAEKWNIGREGEDKGVLVLMAKQEQKVRIEIGYGLEEKLSDTKASDIIQSIIIPEFKKGNYYDGLEKGCSAIINEISGFKNDLKENNTPKGLSSWQVILLFLLASVIIVMIALVSSSYSSKKNHSKSYRNVKSNASSYSDNNTYSDYSNKSDYSDYSDSSSSFGGGGADGSW